MERERERGVGGVESNECRRSAYSVQIKGHFHCLADTVDSLSAVPDGMCSWPMKRDEMGIR